jgi:arsenate reductase-like glutaredoxin family protein
MAKLKPEERFVVKCSEYVTKAMSRERAEKFAEHLDKTRDCPSTDHKVWREADLLVVKTDNDETFVMDLGDSSL